MRLAACRIPPVSETEWTDEQRLRLAHLFAGKQPSNVTATLERHPEAHRGLWGRHVMGETQTLSPRERELLILRTGWLCNAEYEWGRHTIYGLEAGLTDDEIARVRRGPADPSWMHFDAMLLRAADELHGDQFVSDATWAALSVRYETKQLMDIVFTVGQYTAICMALNSFGVQLEPGVAGF